LEAWSLDLPTYVTAWSFDAAIHWWQAGFSVALPLSADLPRTLAPGQAIYVNTDAPTELPIANPSERICYYHQDHLGSSGAIADADGELAEEIANFPFGVLRNEYRLRAIETHYSFTQKERDRESGLQYFEARYLSGPLSRFVVVDPKYANPDGLSATSAQTPSVGSTRKAWRLATHTSPKMTRLRTPCLLPTQGRSRRIANTVARSTTIQRSSGTTPPRPKSANPKVSIPKARASRRAHRRSGTTTRTPLIRWA
jgi:RHS repeat-associated protein